MIDFICLPPLPPSLPPPADLAQAEDVLLRFGVVVVVAYYKK